MTAAWFCPSCQKHHGPHVDTCPAEGTGGGKVDDSLDRYRELQKFPVDWPVYPSLTAVRHCPKCGIRMDGVMGYCCPDAACPTGLGGTTCMTTSVTDPNTFIRNGTANTRANVQ